MACGPWVALEAKSAVTVPRGETAMARRKRVFIGYSHEDREWLQRIREQLAVLEREGLIFVFTDKEIGAG